MSPTFEVVVAIDDDRGIGKAGGLPWRVPADMAHFKRITLDAPPGHENAVIMGRSTWESIPDRFRPLPDRHNVVLSRRPSLELPEGVDRARDLDEALLLAAQAGAWTSFVIGGALVYREALEHPACSRLWVTRIDGRHDCDTFFPVFEDDYRLEDEIERGDSGGHPYRIETWRRHPAPGS